MRKPSVFIPYCLLFVISLFFTSCTESFEDRCRREAKEFTDLQCPRLVDKHIMLDSMTDEANPQGFVYHYRVTGELDNPDILTDEALAPIIEAMLKNLRENISLRLYKERGLTFTYRYLSDSTGEPFVNVSFGPEDYQ